jgi:hypothetical protein
MEGCRTIVFSSKSGEHRIFTKIYYIPRLKTSILSIGQLDELGYEANINSGVMWIKDAEKRLLVRCHRRRTGCTCSSPTLHDWSMG